MFGGDVFVTNSMVCESSILPLGTEQPAGEKRVSFAADVDFDRHSIESTAVKILSYKDIREIRELRRARKGDLSKERLQKNLSRLERKLHYIYRPKGNREIVGKVVKYIPIQVEDLAFDSIFFRLVSRSILPTL